MRRAVLKITGTLLGAVPVLVRDLAGLVGVGLVTYGAWLTYEPAGYIVLGLALLTATCLSVRGR